MRLTAQQWRVLLNIADGRPWFEGSSDNYDYERMAPVIGTLCDSYAIGSRNGLGLVTTNGDGYALTERGVEVVAKLRDGIARDGGRNG